MRKYIMAAVIAVGATVVAWYAFSGKGSAAIDVNDVAADPSAYTGKITVTGIMAGASPSDSSLFGIMDKKELQCTTPGCNKLLLPVRTKSSLPAMGDEVRVFGSFANGPGGLVFVAEKVVTIRNHKIGG